MVAAQLAVGGIWELVVVRLDDYHEVGGPQLRLREVVQPAPRGAEVQAFALERMDDRAGVDAVGGDDKRRQSAIEARRRIRSPALRPSRYSHMEGFGGRVPGPGALRGTTSQGN